MICTARKKNGEPCRNKAKRGEEECASHLGTAHRPTKLNEDVTHRVTALLRNGNYIATACQVAGISVQSYYAWTERGEADTEQGHATVFAEFAEACARARGEGEALLLQTIRQAAQGTERRPGDWRAAAWILERTAPDKFGQRQEVKHTGGLRTSAPEVPDDADRLADVAGIMAEIGVLPTGGAS